MKSLIISLFLFMSLISYSQFYERIGHTREQILLEFKKYNTVDKITERNSLLYICTDKTEIFYIFDEYDDICNNVFVVPLNNKIKLTFLEEYKKMYNKDEDGYFVYLHDNINIKLCPLFSCNDELFFVFKEKSIR